MDDYAYNELDSVAVTENSALKYDGEIFYVFCIYMLTVILKAVTFGVYGFWGKTRIRRYTVSRLSLGGDRFEYLGTGKELFLGAVIAFVSIAPVFGVVVGGIFVSELYMNVPGYEYVATLSNIVFKVMVYLLMSVLISFAMYSSLRYRMRRLSWRGIRAHMEGSAWVFAVRSIYAYSINFLSLGIMIPFNDVGLFKYRVKHMSLGDLPVQYEGQFGDLMKVNMITLLLMLPTLGISRIFYRAAVMRYHAKHLSLGSIRFEMEGLRGGRLLGFFIVNALIFIFTLGLGGPIIMHRTFQFFAKHLSVLGDLDAFWVEQAVDHRKLGGEGLASLFELNVGW